MPCANPVARSCVRSVANAADAIAGLSRPPGSLIYSDFVSGLGGADPLLGYSLLGGQYEGGVLVGLRPACDDLTFAGLPGVRGMRTMWQVTNLNASNGLSGWSKIGVDVVSDIAFPTIGPGQHIATSLASVFTAGTSYTATLRLHVLTQIFVQVTFTSLTHGVTQYANIDMFNGVCTYSTGCAVYVRKIGDIVEIQYTATATTSGNGSVAIVFIPNGTSLRVPSYTGDGVSSVEFISLMLSATSYPVPYVPPGTTQTTTAHNGTSGIHYAMPQNGPVWNQLNGKPDGVELVTNGGFESTSGWSLLGTSLTIVGGKLIFAEADATYRYCRQNYVFSVGARYKVTITGSITSGTYQFVVIGGASVIVPITFVNGVATFEFTALTGNSQFEISRAAGINSAEFDNISIQKLVPQPLTLATRIVMGVGSAELPLDIELNWFSSSGTPPSDLYSLKVSGSGRIARSHDKTLQTFVTGEWTRYEQLILAMQVNTAGTQFRVGAYRVAAKTWSWSAWTAYDGSFNPSAVYQKLMLAFGNNYPMWHLRHWISDYQAPDSDILSAMGVAA